MSQQIPQHLWDPLSSACAAVGEIYDKGPNCQYEDVVWLAWEHICIVYFPPYATSATGPRWFIHRESYRGQAPKRPHSVKPDVMTVKWTPGQTKPSDRQKFDKRDYLWVECKAPIYDTPSGWKGVLEESVERLTVAHPNRSLFLILAVGYKFMWFFWDPLNQIPAQRQLSIRQAKNTGTWPVDPRIKAVQSPPWVDTTTGEVSCGNALELECEKTVKVGDQTVLQNINSLNMLEQFLITVRNAPLQGLNPVEMT